MLRDIVEYTPSRNMIAHDFFVPAQNASAVVFMPIKAKGKFNTPTLSWTADEFNREYEKIEAFANGLLQLTVRLEHASFSVDKLELPMKIVGSSARERRQSLRPQERSDSGPTTPEIKGEAQHPDQEFGMSLYFDKKPVLGFRRSNAFIQQS
jgi:hypothetical protein